MIDRGKVAVMTRQAMEERHHHREALPAENYYLYDYVSFQVIKGILGITVLFLLITACRVIYTLESWISTISLDQLIDTIYRVVSYYIWTVILSCLVLIPVYVLRYRKAQKRVDEQRANMIELNRFYHSGERKWGK